jgi:AraC family transcriptional regulator
MRSQEQSRMVRLEQGKYIGKNQNAFYQNGLILSESLYQKGLSSSWHFHENSYFGLVINGGCLEERRKESVEYTAGNLVFYNWQEPHKNSNYQHNTKIFNLEFSKSWLKEMDLRGTASGAIKIKDPAQKFKLLRIFRSYKSGDKLAELDIESGAIQLISSLTDGTPLNTHIPDWTLKLRDLLHDCCQENFSLKELSEILKVHPVTISKYFPKYFQCTMGEYRNKIRINKSLALISSSTENLTSIAYACGFSDQSHFIKVFKRATGFLPHHYRVC